MSECYWKRTKRYALARLIMKISLVIPVYNESKIISNTILSANEYLSSTFYDYELIIVNDGSKDNTADIIEKHKNEHIRHVSYEQNRGKGHAVRTGMLSASGDFVFFTDADLAYGLEIIGQAVELFDTDTDVIVGARNLAKDSYSQYPALRRAASKVFSVLTRCMSGMAYDTQCGFKGWRREASDRVFSKCNTDGYTFDFEALMIAEKLGMKIRQIPAVIINHNSSKVRVFHDGALMLRSIIKIRRAVSARF